MNEKIQSKIDDYRRLANHPLKVASEKNVSGSHSDSLSMAIRSKKEADIFMAELNAIIEFERSKAR